MSIQSLLNQEITITSKSGYNEYGRETSGAAVTVNARFQKTQKINFNPTNVPSEMGALKVIVGIVYVPAGTVVAIDDKVTYGGVDYKVNGVYDAIDGNGNTQHIKLDLVKWKAT